MFRYGGPSWQGTGITTGLDTPPRIDLAQGGRTIGGGTIHGTPMGNRTGFQTPYAEGYNRIQWNKPPRTPLNITKIAEVGSTGSTTANTAKNTVKKVIEKLATTTNNPVWKFNERAVVNWITKKGMTRIGTGIMGAGLSWPAISALAIVYGATKLAPLLEEPTEALIDELEEAGVLDPLSPGFSGQFGFGTAAHEIMKEEKGRQEFFEKEEAIGPVPPEGLDIAGVIRDSDKKTKIDTDEEKNLKEDAKNADKNAMNFLEQRAKDNPESVLTPNEIASPTIPLFDRIYGAQEADIKRNAWLMLAKFGARLMEKPVGEAAEESLTDFEKIAKEKRDLRAITTMKEAEWEHQEELQILKGLSANPSKQMEYIHLLKDKYMREDKKLSNADALAKATDYVLQHGASTTSGIIKEAQSQGTRLAIANGETVTTRIYDKLGLDIVNDKNLTTANLIRLPKKMIKEKITDAEGKTKKVPKEIINFKDFTILPDVFYFDDKTGIIFQYTGTTPIVSWSDLQISTDDKTWDVYKK